MGLYGYGTPLPTVYEEAWYPSTTYMSEHEPYTLESQRGVSENILDVQRWLLNVSSPYVVPAGGIIISLVNLA